MCKAFVLSPIPLRVKIMFGSNKSDFSTFWCYVKGQKTSVEGVWNFENGLTVNGSPVVTQADLTTGEVTSFNGRTGHVTLTSPDVVSALTFTPESVSNKATSFGTLNNNLYPTTLAVSNYVNGLGFLTNANNGLSLSGTTAQLGGNLLQDTSIGLAGFQLFLNGDSNTNFIIDDTNSLVAFQAQGNQYASGIVGSGNNLQLYIRTITNTFQSGINLSAGSIQVLDTFNSKGFVYAADYSAAGLSDPLWIPNLGAVQGLITGAGYLTSINSSMITTALGYTPADDSNVVHQTGNEPSIAGDKGFSGTTTFNGDVLIPLSHTTFSDGGGGSAYLNIPTGYVNFNRVQASLFNLAGTFHTWSASNTAFDFLPFGIGGGDYSNPAGITDVKLKFSQPGTYGSGSGGSDPATDDINYERSTGILTWKGDQLAVLNGNASDVLLGDGTFATYGGGGGGGSVTSLTDNTANGVAITWTSRTSTPVPTVVLGAITPTSTNGVSAATMAFMDATSSVQGQFNSILSKILTGLTITGSAITSSSTILGAFGALQNQINGIVGGLVFKGVWDASANSPTITSGVGTLGWFYKVGTAGTTTIDGVSLWSLHDLILFDGTAWDKIDGAASEVTTFNTRTGAITLTSSDVTTALTFTPENVANKATSFATLNSTLYPTTQAVATYVSAQGFLTANQTITLSGDISGSGATAITTTIGALKVVNSMIANTTIDVTTKITGVVPSANLGSGTANSTTVLYGDSVYRTVTSGFTNPMTTAGDLIIGGTSGTPGRIGIGADLQVLTISSTTHLPVWADASVTFSGSFTGSSSLVSLLTPTVVKTANYTAAPGDFVICDTATTGSFNVLLPTAPVDQTLIAIKMVLQSGTRTVSINVGGTDVFNKTGGSTSLTLSLLNQGVLLEYNFSAGIWYVVSDDLPLGALDSRYLLQTGTTLPASYLASSLTSVGTLSGLTVTAAPTFSAMTNHSVLFAGTAGLLSQDNNNFYYDSTLHGISIDVAGDFSGTNSVNIYGQYDSYEPQSTIGTITSGTLFPGGSASTSRGTGASPVINNTADNIGAWSFWGYTGSSPAYTFMAGMVGSITGSSSSNLGGQLDFYIKADGGSQASAMTIGNDKTITMSKYGTGLLHSSSAGILTSSLVAIADHSATGTPSSTTFLRGDNTWATPSGGSSASIGGTLTSGTAGSILFSGSAVFAQDNANFFWDATNHRLGIGTATPASQFSLKSSAATNTALFNILSTTGTEILSISSNESTGVATLSAWANGSYMSFNSTNQEIDIRGSLVSFVGATFVPFASSAVPVTIQGAASQSVDLLQFNNNSAVLQASINQTGQYNKVTITRPATTATLTIANNGSLITSGAFAGTLTFGAATNATFPTGTGTLAYLAGNNTWSGTQTFGVTSFGLASKIGIVEGTGGRTGQTTLVAGTIAITITGLTTSSRAFVQLVAQGGTSTTVYAYKAVCTSNTLTITAETVAGVAVTTDTSTLNYIIVN